MNAYEFQAKPKDGCIEIPVEYRDETTGTVRVIVSHEGQPPNDSSDVSTTPITNKLRPFGLYAGEFVVPDDFNAPLSE